MLRISCFTLSLKCFSYVPNNCPDMGIRPLIQFLHLPRAGPITLTLLFTASDLASITSHIHSWVLCLLWLHPFILFGVISPLISSSVLGTYWPGEYLFQYPIILPFHTVRGVLKARILKWFAVPFSSGPQSVPFHYRGLECKSRKSRKTWSNRQIWPWNVEWSRAKTNRVFPRKCTGHSKHPLPTTQEKTLHMDITRWSSPKSDWLYSLQQKMEKL